jgi:DNA polymerase III delta prime subunit
MSRKKWRELYGDNSSTFEKAINRSKLARILTFYAEKGIRHNLDQQAYDKLMKEIKKMIREGDKYVMDKIEEADHLDRGYIFCPEYLARNASNISVSGDQSIWLFGPNSVPTVPPVIPYDSPSTPSNNSESQTPPDKEPNQADTPEIESQDSKENRQEPKRKNSEIILGRSEFSDDSVTWNIDVRSNPHLMIVGLPGMGKTTCLINLCLQMIQAEIYPIVFSYHEDIDDLLEKKLGDNLHFVDFAGLGFNPLEVVGDVSHAYVDNISMIRDIFRAIFPDLGDIQLGALREALKKSYTDLGWAEFDGKSNRPPLPEFQTFYDTLCSREKRDSGLITRLSELNDYGFFKNISGAKSLLDIARPSVIRIHQTQNETLQRAFSTFVLHNLYQRMFQRGPRNQITHAIIFDEAHRAAKLKLIHKMIKECRKFGIAFVLASQEAKDFDQSVYSAVANYLVLRVSENDAKVMSRVIASSDQVNAIKDMLKRMPKYGAFFTREGLNRPARITLKDI